MSDSRFEQHLARLHQPNVAGDQCRACFWDWPCSVRVLLDRIGVLRQENTVLRAQVRQPIVNRGVE